LQSCLASSRTLLGDEGILYPGSVDSHVAAVRYPLRWPATATEERIDRERWETLIAECREHTGRVVVSAESLASANESSIETITNSFARDDVHVVVTIRSLAHILPSAWQEDVKAGVRTSFGDWLERVCDRPPAMAAQHPFWVVHDHSCVIDRWARAVGAENVTVVILDSSDRNVVFRAFEQLLGLRHGALRADLATKQNRSLTAAESELLRRYNERAGFGDTPTLRKRPIPANAIWSLLDGRGPAVDEARLEVPRRFLEQVSPISDRIMREISEMGVQVVGDLDRITIDGEMIDSAPTADAAAPDWMSIDTAVALLAGVLRPNSSSQPG
jgi:hypothetical protein